jgi:uridine kinase
MIGDKLVITDYHRQGAAQVFAVVQQRLESAAGALCVTVAGESGSGKSEIAHCLAELLEQSGYTTIVLGQDDYFRLSPKSNHEKRLQDISWVGPGEVRLDLLGENIANLKEHPDRPLKKPLVYFQESRIDSEIIEPKKRDVVIVEGTYTSLLENVDVRAFIDRNYRQTKKARLKRARDPDVDFLEKVLEIEHQEISKHKARADAVIPPPPEEQEP